MTSVSRRRWTIWGAIGVVAVALELEDGVDRQRVYQEIQQEVNRITTLPEDAEEPEALYSRLAAAGKTRREAVKEVSRTLGIPAREVYRRVLEAEKGRRSLS